MVPLGHLDTRSMALVLRLPFKYYPCVSNTIIYYYLSGCANNSNQEVATLLKMTLGIYIILYFCPSCFQS